MKIKSLSGILAIALSLASPLAVAHGPVKPLHGGVAIKVDETHYEQVANGDAVTIYIYDHGKPIATQGASGKLTVLNGTVKSEIALTPAGDNRLQAQGAKFSSGTKSVATITLKGGKPSTVRFAIK